jgi:hypothetical protein
MLSRLVEGWAQLYGDSKYLSAGVTFLHLGGILVAGGFALAEDRAAILLLRETEPDYRRELPLIESVHVWVMTGLAVVAATGLMMLLADLHAYLTSLLFWTKMVLMAALLANGWVRMRAEHLLRDGVTSRRALLGRTSFISISLWFLVLLAGALLPTIS